MAFYNRCFTRLLYFISLILFSSTVFSSEYYKTTLAQAESTQLDARGRLTDFDTDQSLNNEIKKATLYLSTKQIHEIIGSSMRSRIFANTSLGGSFSDLGVQNIKDLLISLDYNFDYPNSEIYIYDDFMRCKNFGYKWKNSLQQVYSCPEDAASSAIATRCVGLISQCHLEGLYTDDSYTVSINTLPSNASISVIYARFTYSYNAKPAPDYMGEVIRRDEKMIYSESHKLTDEELAKIMLGYDNNFYWTSVKEIFTAANNFEITNNLAYLELHKALSSSSNIASDDEVIKPDLDEEGESTGGFKLPAFCDYAPAVCNFFTWFRDSITDTQDSEIDIKQSDIDSTHNINPDKFPSLGDGGCPPDYVFNITILGYTDFVTISYTNYCNFIRGLAPYLVFGSWLAAAFIIAGVRNA